MNFDLTPDQEQLQARVREFAEAEVAPIAEKLDRDGKFPTELFKKLGELGVMSIPFADKYGGMGLGVFESVLALEEVARADQSLAVSAMVSMATGLTLARFGSQPMIDKWLPEIVTRPARAWSAMISGRSAARRPSSPTPELILPRLHCC
jgi:short/branched chain acyl-CoA dehydrogenase